MHIFLNFLSFAFDLYLVFVLLFIKTRGNFRVDVR